MRSETAVAAAITAVTGLVLLGVALYSLRPGSRFRRGYGIDPEDDGAARSNALVVGLCGVGTLALAAAIAIGVSERVIGTGAVLASAGLCVGLGWFVRYRDRRELLTTPRVDRETARRLGASAIVCGLLVLPLAPAIWFGVSDAVRVSLVAGGFLLTVVAIACAYR
ncbi:hypothetical protein BRC82_01545 [Halobacteriales archaeon QS_1_67_19]|nr:MAG: hypothetical protein BRC82_01545 [Halobacteriales archaeon QS_1_67_19]